MKIVWYSKLQKVRKESGLRYALFSLARKPGSWVRIPLRAWMFSVCVCVCVCVCACVCVCMSAFFCVCVQVEALRRADHQSKESYRNVYNLVNRSETESFMEIGKGPNWGCSAKGEKK
jgi:hypothetical protein